MSAEFLTDVAVYIFLPCDMPIKMGTVQFTTSTNFKFFSISSSLINIQIKFHNGNGIT